MMYYSYRRVRRFEQRHGGGAVAKFYADCCRLIDTSLPPSKRFTSEQVLQRWPKIKSRVDLWRNIHALFCVALVCKPETLEALKDNSRLERGFLDYTDREIQHLEDRRSNIIPFQSCCVPTVLENTGD